MARTCGRRKIPAQSSVSPTPDINLSLVLTTRVIGIERIGDYTQNIVELAVALAEVFRRGELHDEIPALGNSDVRMAQGIFNEDKNVLARVELGFGGKRQSSAEPSDTEAAHPGSETDMTVEDLEDLVILGGEDQDP